MDAPIVLGLRAAGGLGCRSKNPIIFTDDGQKLHRAYVKGPVIDSSSGNKVRTCTEDVYLQLYDKALPHPLHGHPQGTASSERGQGQGALIPGVHFPSSTNPTKIQTILLIWIRPRCSMQRTLGPPSIMSVHTW